MIKKLEMRIYRGRATLVRFSANTEPALRRLGLTWLKKHDVDSWDVEAQITKNDRALSHVRFVTKKWWSK